MKTSRTVLTDVSTNNGASTRSAGHSPTTTTSRRFLVLCLSPLLLLGATCATSAALHHQQNRSGYHSAEFPNGASGPAADDARDAAKSFLGRVLGSQVDITNSELVNSYALRQKPGNVQQWSVFCETQEGNYLLRINAQSHRVYAMNRMENSDSYTRAAGEYTGDPSNGNDTFDPDGKTTDNDVVACSKVSAVEVDCGNEIHRLTREQAHLRALDYMRKMGFSRDSIKTLPQLASAGDHTPVDPSGHTFHFCFSSRHHQGPIEVGVSSADGHLQTLWSTARPI